MHADRDGARRARAWARVFVAPRAMTACTCALLFGPRPDANGCSFTAPGSRATTTSVTRGFFRALSGRRCLLVVQIVRWSADSSSGPERIGPDPKPDHPRCGWQALPSPAGGGSQPDRPLSGPGGGRLRRPEFTDREVELLRRPNLRAYVVVNERVAEEYRRLGVDKPCYVIPHGVSLASVSTARAAEVRRRYRADGDLIVGYMASWLLSRGDRGGERPNLNVDHLLDLWDEISERLPGARLWLMGGASDRIRRRCAGREDILFHGRIPRDEVLTYLAACDIALYPRTADEGYQASKIIEYMGCGVPTVSYDYEVTSDLREAGAGSS